MLLTSFLNMYVAVFYLEDPIVVRGSAENLVEMLPIGVCNEYLSELVAGHEFHDLLHAVGIELVEDIIEQEQGRGLVIRPFQEVKLCQFQGDDKASADARPD